MEVQTTSRDTTILGGSIEHELMEVIRRLEICFGISDDWRADMLIAKYSLCGISTKYRFKLGSTGIALVLTASKAIDISIQRMETGGYNKSMEYLDAAIDKTRTVYESVGGEVSMVSIHDAETIELDVEMWKRELAAAKDQLPHSL